MIWVAETSTAPGRDAVRAHLRGQLHHHIGGRITQPTLLEDVAAVLATAWREEFCGAPLPPGSLSLMAARALYRVGEPAAARALLDGVTPDADEAAVLHALIEAGGPSLAACVSLGAGILRPVRSAMGGDRPCWKLDLTCLTTPSGDLAELDLPVRLQRILSRTAEIWDGADGDGVLHIIRPGPQVSAHLVWLVRTELPGICRLILERIQVERGWMHCPFVCRLGL